MRLVKKLFFALFFVAVCTGAFCQTGNYVVTNYNIDNSKVDYPFFDIKQDANGILLIAGRNGLLSFDGKRWDRTDTKGTLFSICASSNGNIFVAGKAGVGILTIDDSGERQFQNLSEDWDKAEDVFQLLEHKGSIYAVSPTRIFQLDLEGGLRNTVSGNDSYPFGGLFVIGDEVLVSQGLDEVLKVADGELESRTASLPGIVPLFVAASPSGTSQLVGTMDNRLFHFKEGDRTEILLDREEYSDLDLTCGLWLDEDVAAIGTITQGVVFIDISNAEVQRASDNSSGLLGNEVLTLALDKDHGLWVGESVGLSRIAPDLPITRWDNYNGLVGSLLLAQGVESPYVGTSQGLFQLVEVPKYREVTYYEDVLTGSLEKKPKKSKGKGLLRFLKKKNEEEVVDTRTTSRVERVRQELVSTSYEYQKSEGIDSEIDQYIDGDGFMIVGGLGGVYELQGTDVQTIFEEPIRSLLLTNDSRSLWVNTLDNQLTVFTRNDGKWNKLETASGFTVTIDYMFESSDGFLWLNGADVIYRIYLMDQRIAEIMDYQIDNPFFDKTLSFERGGEVYFVNASGYFNYDEDLDSIVVNKELMGILDVPGKYIADPDGNVWVEGKDDWYRIYGDTIRKEDVLQLFQDIRSVSYKEDAYWIITNKDELFRFSDAEKEQLISNHNLFLKEVTSSDGKISPLKFKRIGEDRSSLVFEFIQPDYAGFFGIKYRYKLLGLDQEWSPWSENNRIQFPYLPNGSYTMLVQTIDIFGQITDSAPLEFKVVPPYWRRPWFYLLEVSVFVTLLLFSIRLRRHSRFSIVSRVLAFMTLILGVEFVQIVAETYFKTGDTPVVEFFIQVGIAFAILPFESILRRAVLGDRGKPAEPAAEVEKE